MTELQSERIKVVFNPIGIIYRRFMQGEERTKFRDVIATCESRTEFEAQIQSFTEKHPSAPRAADVFKAVNKETHFDFTPESVVLRRERFQKFMRHFNCFGDVRDTSLVLHHIEAWVQLHNREGVEVYEVFILRLWVYTAREYYFAHQDDEDKKISLEKTKHTIMARLTRATCDVLKVSKHPSKDLDDYLGMVFQEACLHIFDAYVEYGQYPDKIEDYARRCYEIHIEFKWRHEAFIWDMRFCRSQMLFLANVEQYSIGGERLAMTPARIFYAHMHGINIDDLWTSLTTIRNIVYHVKHQKMLVFCARFSIVKDADALSVDKDTGVVMPRTLPKEVLNIIKLWVQAG